ncbi:hypothetical protein NHX12_023114 [Muraenolepis orangiensis]|uniref:Uncharacterized protein n=1 Tax=Muraenolepis orangiensis TaxID=630683 RepID=A0A9Q0EQ46_9TELE|nr:hypothetical protein NHX12_023114 [Muraenolepis orangiensis]
MFSKATKSFVQQIEDDQKGLIHVSRLNDSHKLVPMAVVIKRIRFWPWQTAKYQPSDFTLSDLLLGEVSIDPVVSQSDFLSYKGTFGDSVTSTLKSGMGSMISVDLAGTGSSKLQLSFGKLRKQQVNVKALLHDCGNRFVDMKHSLMQQVQKKQEVLTVLKERVFTTAPCSILATQKKKGSCNSSPHGSIDGECEVDGFKLSEIYIPDDAPLSALNSELQTLEGYLCPLAELPGRSDLFNTLVETLKDRDTLTLLEHTLEDWCRGEVQQFLPLCNDSPAQVLLDLFCPLPANQSEGGSPAEGGPPPNLKAVHLLVSAMEALPDETLSLLTECSPEILQAIDELICQIRGSSGPLTGRSAPAVLWEDAETWMFSERLLRSSGVTLQREADGPAAKTGSDAGALPLVLCLTLRGLSLCVTTG